MFNCGCRGNDPRVKAVFQLLAPIPYIIYNCLSLTCKSVPITAYIYTAYIRDEDRYYNYLYHIVLFEIVYISVYFATQAKENAKVINYTFAVFSLLVGDLFIIQDNIHYLGL